MVKPITFSITYHFIGFISVFVLMSGFERPTASVTFITAQNPFYLSGTFGINAVASSSNATASENWDNLLIANAFDRQEQDTRGTHPSDPTNGKVWFWVVLSALIAAVLFYLLLQIRRRQALGGKVKILEEEVKVLYNKAPCGYHTVDKNGLVLNANETLLQWLGYAKEEVVKRVNFSDLVVGEPTTVRDKIASISRVKSRRTDVTLIKKNGEHMPVILSLIDAGELGKEEGTALYSTVDNTRCYEAVARIQTLDQELEAFSYSISHDLRAPLRSIDGYSKILEEDYSSRLDDEGRRVLTVVMNNAKRMGKLIDDLLDFGRLGRKALQRTAVNMTGMVQNLMQELSAQAIDRRIEIKIEPLMPAMCDADMIRQVWHNLLENAVKYTGKKENGAINVRSYKLGDNELCYEVKDNGVGFDMQYTDKLFGMFQRLHKMQDFSGTGVGLAIVKRIITRHGGRVWAEGSLDGGATFYFTLPVDDENK